MYDYNRLEKELTNAITAIRDFLGALNSPPNSIELNIEADGRTLEGDIKVVFRLADYYGSSSVTVKGGNLTKVVEEFARRYGWQQMNDALYLPKVKVDEEVPF